MQEPSRKRPAPGSSPMDQQQRTQAGLTFPQVPTSSSATPAQFDDWSGGNNLQDVAASLGNNQANYNTNINAPVNGFQQNSGPFAPQQSNQLVRRNHPQQLATSNRQLADPTWADLGNSPGPMQPSAWDNDDDDELERRAEVARQEAQVNRKQIPPFVQKLSSFLDESRNTDLIRWSDDGNSFIVLDEEKFADTLIPELFKHRNYASFVRQLNMYGFHKRVHMGDNSLRQSENKTKTPSEYFHPYFKRGRPKLLWLIQKPRTALNNSKRKGNEVKQQGDSDDEGKGGSLAGGQISGAEASNTAAQGRSTSPISTSELANLRQELQALQRQQRFISKVLTQVREQNHQLYQQATAFQTLHERHENSINAILTFLATFYNRSLEGQNGPGMARMFDTVPQTVQPQGNVVDMGEYTGTQDQAHNQLHRTAKRPLLLPAPAAQVQNTTTSRAKTESPPVRATHSPQQRPQNQPIPAPPNKVTFDQQQQQQQQQSRRGERSPRAATVSPVLKDDAETPDLLPQAPEASSSDDIMSLIKNANASSANASSSLEGPAFDFPAALSHFQTADGNAPLTPQQRDNMLSLMANNQQAGNANNALMQANMPPMPSLENYEASQQQLDYLQQLQRDQDKRMQELAERLTPLSPSGQIPGYHGTVSGAGNTGGASMDQPVSDLDLNADMNNFIEGGDYFPAAAASEGDGGANEFDLGNLGGDDNLNFDFGPAGDDGSVAGFDGDNADPFADLGGGGGGAETLAPDAHGDGDGGGRIVGSVSSEATSPAATTGGADDGPEETTDAARQSPRKKRRTR